MNYTQEELFDVAKRHNNSKRNYLLVNKKQAKYLPTRPHEVFDMVDDLKNVAVHNGVSLAKPTLVIGFAETATALGELFATKFQEVFYITTTRENDRISDCIEFKEEHSYVVEQRLYLDRLRKVINDFSQVIFVDDEFTTGKTLRNLVSVLIDSFPSLAKCKMYAVTLVNRINSENQKKLESIGIKTCELLKIEKDSFEEEMNSIKIDVPQNLLKNFGKKKLKQTLRNKLKSERNIKLSNYDIKHGVKCGGGKILNLLATQVFEQIKPKSMDKSILVLGTEEFMTLPIHVAHMLETFGYNVMCQATARTPIGINSILAQYPIKKGLEMPSLYGDRSCYLYNLKKYDEIIVFTNAVPKGQKIGSWANYITYFKFEGGILSD